MVVDGMKQRRWTNPSICIIRYGAAILRAALFLAALQPLDAAACKYTVRDVAFVTLQEQPYRLFIYTDPGGDEQTAAALQAAAKAALADANIVVESVAGALTEDSPAARIAKQTAVQSLPALVLADPDDRGLQLFGEDNAKIDPQAVRDICDRLTSSTGQLELRKLLLAGRHSVIVLHEGVDDDQNQRAREMVDSLVADVERSLPSLPKAIDLPPQMLTVSHEQSDSERVFLWSLGIEEEEFDQTHIAVVFGRCRLLGPAMPVPGTTRQQVVRRLAVVGQDCECELDRAVMRGQMIPHAWSTREEAVAAEMLGFDPGNPLVQVEIQRILARGPVSREGGVANNDALATNDLALGGLQIIDIDSLVESDVEESSLETESDPSTQRPEEDLSPPAAATASAATSEGPPDSEPAAAEPSYSTPASVARGVTWLIVGIVIVGAIGAVWILVRAG